MHVAVFTIAVSSLDQPSFSKSVPCSLLCPGGTVCLAQSKGSLPWLLPVEVVRSALSNSNCLQGTSLPGSAGHVLSGKLLYMGSELSEPGDVLGAGFIRLVM